MDETEFRRLLDLFPVVRSRDYQAELDSSRNLTSRSAEDESWQDASNEEDKMQLESQDAFWQKLKLAAGRKVSAADAEKFCQAFQQFHKKLVYEGLNLDVARSYINSSNSLEE
ncbi:uncharacterized protein LOC123225551 [Mangifera indica]|uniref:uncharacterized protein LOC123225551 n=1 Tax=Mangifera indica TaxID=29780 RepID=UPI001CF99F4B|nr:uncharacterized protein LOC123225551 [Mangifera indica]XP_044505507.1 uncharacterized protein LOC123225551 [Mangifera indica]XP_044505508.1 uncharacterized protein LOC123225551 [Mangifera indica]